MSREPLALGHQGHCGTGSSFTEAKVFRAADKTDSFSPPPQTSVWVQHLPLLLISVVIGF